MKKIRNNQGHTIPIALVIIIVLTILTSTIVYAVSVSTKKTNNMIIEYTTKLEIENVMYQFLNDVVENDIELTTQEQEYNNKTFRISLVAANVYSFIVTSDTKYALNATIKFNTNSYEILKWGFGKE